jgi:hypothetical protein
MNFGAVRNDKERVLKSVQLNSFLDITPTKPEHLNWNLRPRTREYEIGPEFKFKAKLQAERLMDSMNKSAGYLYTSKDVKGKKSDLFMNDKEL